MPKIFPLALKAKVDAEKEQVRQNCLQMEAEEQACYERIYEAKAELALT